MRRERREAMLAGVLAAEADQLHAMYRDRGGVRPSGLADAVAAWVSRDQDQPMLSADDAEALIREASMLGLLVGLKIGRSV